MKTQEEIDKEILLNSHEFIAWRKYITNQVNILLKNRHTQWELYK